MDLNRLGLDRLNVQFKDLKSGNMMQRAFAEVILIDRSNDLNQMCYLLKNDKAFSGLDGEGNLNQNLPNFDKNDFQVVGVVVAIDKKNKYVTLKDENTISYNHLIIASGPHYSMISYEFLAGVHTLVDAIRVRKKIPSAFPKAVKSSQSEKRKMKTAKTSKSDMNFPRKIDNIKARKINKQKTNDTIPLGNTNKRLYEVQI